MVVHNMGLYRKTMDKFYVAWRKSIRRLFNIPRTIHGVHVLLNEICDDIPVHLNIRFINFYRSLLNSSNTITNTCAKLALHGSKQIGGADVFKTYSLKTSWGRLHTSENN